MVREMYRDLNTDRCISDERVIKSPVYNTSGPQGLHSRSLVVKVVCLSSM